MANIHALILIWFFIIFMKIKSEETSNTGGTKCVNYEGHPKMCYPPFQNHASAGLKVTATNTCGLVKRQKYCVGLSSAEMRSRCAYCDNSNPEERHIPDYLTDHNINNWWQSETLADNKTIHYEQSINLTLNLGKQFHVTFIHLQFKSPRPRAMIIYKKYDDNYPWKPWLYLASNCKTYFNMDDSKGRVIQRFDDVLCTEEFSSLNDFYNGIVMFATIFGRPGADDFFNNKKIMDWATASQIRIELKKMHTFGDQNAEEELLMTYFYAIKSVQVAARCWCNGHGNECRRSTGEGVEPKLFCVCHPLHHTTGQSCEKCENFYQDRPWQMATEADPHVCKSCNCNGNSDSCIFNEELYVKSGNVSGGLCLNCLMNTKGPHCEECLEGFYKDLRNPNRCIPCNCDQRGRQSAQCDDTGKCVCQPGVDGDKCTRCKGDHFNFGSFGCQPCNCNLDGINSTDRLQCNPSTGVCYCKKHVIGEKCESCVQGYFSLSGDDPLGCRPCFCFAHTKECTNASGFVMIPIVSEFGSNEDNWKYGVGTEQPSFNPMLDVSEKLPAITWFQNREPWKNNYFLWAPAKFLGNHRLSYNLFLDLTLSFSSRPDQKILEPKIGSMINDVELVSDTLSVSVPFNVENNPFPETGKQATVFRFRLSEESGLWRDRMDHFRFISILSNLVAVKIRLTNPLGYIKLHKAVLFTAVEQGSGQSLVVNGIPTTNIEKCSCPQQYTGLSCENCAIGYHRQSSKGTEFVKCIKCMCNNQSDICDVRTGKCFCKYNTTGDNCERCNVGFYGDPTTSIRNVCKPCGCPGGTGCELVKMADWNRVVCTDCPDNLGGYRCERCRDNYFGNPKLNISCQPCNCHGNMDYLNSCNSISGKCSNCLYNSAGDHCESCQKGFHLSENILAPNRCKRCICSPIGSIDGGLNCDVNTGQCKCYPFVTGHSCDICKPGFFNLTPISACEQCQCFILGSINHTCDMITGQCPCKPGVTGTNCDKCEPGHFNLSKTGCQRCDCDYFGSKSPNCNVITGDCHCKENVVGKTCDKCLENHHNITDNCPSCPPCYSLIHEKINSVKTELNVVFGNINSRRNSSDNKLTNLTNLMVLAENLNKTVNELFDVMLKNYTLIISVQDEVEKSKKSILNLSKEIFDLNGKKKNELLTDIIGDIKKLKERIEDLIKVAFKDNLEKLKNYINDKSISDSSVTKMAEVALSSSNDADQLKNQILNKIDQTERDLNNSLVYFLELVSSYYKFVNESGDFDTSALSKLSDKINSDGFSNMMVISNIDKKQDELDKLLNETNQQFKDINSKTNELFKELSSLTSSAGEFEEKLQKYIMTLPNIESMEKEIMSKSRVNIIMTKNMTDLRELRKRLDDAQQNITDAVAKAQNILLKLQKIDQDFDEVVKLSKIEATTNLAKLPQLKSELTLIEIEIKNLHTSSYEIINTMKLAYNNSQEVYLKSKELETKYKDLQSKILEPKRQSSVDLEFSLNIKSLVENELKNDSYFIAELQNISKIIIKANLVNGNQKNSIESIEKKLRTFEQQLNLAEEKSKTMSDDKIDLYSKTIDSISEDFKTYEDNQIRTLSAEMNLMNEELLLLTREIDETDVEIKRLELINEYMIGSSQCHKSGGKIES